MAYNNYYGYGNTYIPPYRPTQTYPNANMGMQQPQSQDNFFINDFRFVNEAEAASYLLQGPNMRAILVDRSNGNFWLKTSNAIGESFSEKFKYEKVDETTGSTKNDTTQYVQKDDMKNFITREDFKELSDQVSKLEKRIKINNIINEET